MNKDKTELEEAIKELKNIWKETDFENSKRRVAIETVLKALERYKRLAEMNLKNSEEFKNSIPKKKIENEIEKTKEDIERFVNERNKGDIMNFWGHEILKAKR